MAGNLVAVSGETVGVGIYASCGGDGGLYTETSVLLPLA